MATAEIARPGVTVLQSVRRTSPTFLRPTLAPVVVGPAFEVVNVLTADGAVNSKALYGAYGQVKLELGATDYPDPRGNVDELTIQQASVKPYLLTGGHLSELKTEPGEGFLKASHGASKARMTVTGTSFAVNGLNLVLAVDQPVALNSDRDVTVDFVGGGTLSPSEIVDQINSAFGIAIAEVTYDGNGAPNGLQISSPTYGALSSLTVRATGTANQALNLGWSGGIAQAQRIEASGFRAYDLGNNETQSPWIEFFRGEYYAAGVAADAGAWAAHCFLVNVETGVATNGRVAAPVTFGAGNTIPIEVGDQFYCDGLRLKSAEVSHVDSDKFRLGTINTTFSVADENGNYTKKVYDDALLGLTIDATPFAPKWTWFKATGLMQNDAAVKASLVGTVDAVAAVAAVFTAPNPPDFSGGGDFYGLTIDYTLTEDGVLAERQFVFAGHTAFAAAADVAAYLSANDRMPGLTVDVNAGALRFTTAKTNSQQSVSFLASGSGNAVLGLSTSQAGSATGTDATVAGLTGKVLSFSFDKGAHTYEAVFTDDSLDKAVALVNQVVGAVVAAKSGGTKFALTSQLAGEGSAVTVSGTAVATLGLSPGTPTAGDGRPNPDAYFTDEGILIIGASIVRDPMTGYPLDFATSPAQLYVQYKALRKDVSPLAANPGVLRIPDTDTLASVLDPIDETNPLGLACYLGMLNCPGFEFKALGVDEVSASAPEGTELAYSRAAGMLEAEEVYAVAPLTQNDVVHALFTTHVTLMSEPEQTGERIVFFNKKMPVTKSPATAASGVSANGTATANQLRVDVTPQQGLIDAGLDPTAPFTVDDGVYVEFNWEGVFYRYNVASVSGGLVNLNLSFLPAQNADLFYSTAKLPTGIANAPWVMKVRGDSLTIPGSSRLDYSLVADTVSEANAGILNRRAFSVFPDKVKLPISGVEKELPGYYACAAIAGMVAGLAPQQGFTNYPITGLSGVTGVSNFTRKQLNRMAGGGTYIVMQEVQGGPVFSRHQLSTDTSSIETRELSITKVVDFVAKFLRSGVRRFIGRQNINAVFLDSVGTTIQGMLQFLQDNGIINGFTLNNIIQDPTNPDTVLLDITLDVPFPCNYIRLTLVV